MVNVDKELEKVIASMSLEKSIEYCHKLQEEAKRISMSLEIAKALIIERLKVTKEKQVTAGNITASIITRISKWITVKEAESLLDEDTLGKLLHESTTVFLQVRERKESTHE